MTTTTKGGKPAPDALLTEIARKHLNIETLEERKSDSLDFHDCAVWTIHSALEEAYQAGLRAGLAQSHRAALRALPSDRRDGGACK
jgi:hypothetical protein